MHKDRAIVECSRGVGWLKDWLIQNEKDSIKNLNIKKLCNSDYSEYGIHTYINPSTVTSLCLVRTLTLYAYIIRRLIIDSFGWPTQPTRIDMFLVSWYKIYVYLFYVPSIICFAHAPNSTVQPFRILSIINSLCILTYSHFHKLCIPRTHSSIFDLFQAHHTHDTKPNRIQSWW